MNIIKTEHDAVKVKLNQQKDQSMYFIRGKIRKLELLFNMSQDLCGLHKCSHSAMKNLQALLTIYAKI